MWLYICYNGRYPSRVAFSLRIITVLASVAGFAILFTQRPIQPGKRWQEGLGCKALVVLALAAALFGFSSAWDAVGRASAPERAAYYVYADEHPEALFLRDTKLSYSNREDSPSTNEISTGGWLHYSPLYEKKLADLGLTEISRSTLLQPNVYLIAAEDKDIRTLLGVGKKTPLDYEVVAELDGVCIYQFFSIG